MARCRVSISRILQSPGGLNQASSGGLFITLLVIPNPTKSKNSSRRELSNNIDFALYTIK